jgi:diguanylate cyclase
VIEMATATGELSSDRTRDALATLEQAVYHHDQWLEAISATMVCRLPPDARDVDVDAHKKCRFGQWYYSAGTDMMRDHPGFLAIEQEHRRMHELAAALLHSMTQGNPFTLRDYTNFAQTAKRMRLEISTLKAELEDTLLNTDPLTGAMNRSGMLTRMREQQELVRRDVMSCVIVMMDLDHFKAINDAHGHLVGDRVLIACARHLRSNLRPYDRLFRYGGEEFLLCAPNTDVKAARSLVERLRKGLAALVFEDSDRTAFHITVSFGLSLLDPQLPVEQSIDHADKALYSAKSAGRNRTVIWDRTMV